MFEDILTEPKEYDPENPCEGCDMEGIFCDACVELQKEIERDLKIWPDEIDLDDDLTPI